MNRLCALIFLLMLTAFAQNQQDVNLFITGSNFERAGSLEKAKEIYEGLYNKDKNSFQYFDALNRVLLQLKDYEASAALIEERLKINPQDINLYGILGKTYHMSGDEAKAFTAWDKALEFTDGNPALYRVIANFAIERRAFKKAVEILKKGKEAAGGDETFAYDLANLYALLMQYEEAADEYCSVLYEKPEQYNLVEARVFSYINKPDALDQTIKVVEDYRKNISIKHLLGKLYIHAGEFEKAYDIYSGIENDGNYQGVELFNFAQMAYAEKEYKFASIAYSEIIENYPASPYMPMAKLGYAKTLEGEIIGESTYNASGVYKVKVPEKLQEVVTAYQELVDLYSVTEVGLEANFRIGYIKFHYQNNPEEAEKHFFGVIKTAPVSRFSIDSHAEIGEIHIARGELNEAYDSFSKIVSDERIPEDKKRNAEYRLAQIKFYQGDFPEARNILNRLVQNLKDYSANDAIEMSLLLNSTMSDSSNLLLFSEAELLALQRKFEVAAEKYRLVYKNQGTFMVQHLSKIREAEMELAMNRTENAVILLRKIADEKEKNIYADKALYLLGRIYQDTIGDSPKAVEIYEDLLVKFPNSLYIDEAREEIIKLRNKLS